MFNHYHFSLSKAELGRQCVVVQDFHNISAEAHSYFLLSYHICPPTCHIGMILLRGSINFLTRSGCTYSGCPSSDVFCSLINILSCCCCSKLSRLQFKKTTVLTLILLIFSLKPFKENYNEEQSFLIV